jgi:hypothetical protein
VAATAATTPAPDDPVVPATVTSPLAATDPVIAAATWIAVLVGLPPPLVATFTVTAVPLAATLNGVLVPETTRATVTVFPSPPGVTAVQVSALLAPTFPVARVALVGAGDRAWIAVARAAYWAARRSTIHWNCWAVIMEPPGRRTCPSPRRLICYRGSWIICLKGKRSITRQ